VTKEEAVKRIISRHGDCKGVVCSSCPLRDSCGDEGTLKRAEKWIQEHDSEEENMKREFRIEEPEEQEEKVVVTFYLVRMGGSVHLRAKNNLREDKVLIALNSVKGKAIRIENAQMAGIETDEEGRILFDD